mmetsp:Transcript_23169/g.39622  ORF Transcript_23169/g.39622 Transcript_23169/m.39622 type:complete len:343 (-) Transcript_23169:13-1041(-)
MPRVAPVITICMGSIRFACGDKRQGGHRDPVFDQGFGLCRVGLAPDGALGHIPQMHGSGLAGKAAAHVSGILFNMFTHFNQRAGHAFCGHLRRGDRGGKVLVPGGAHIGGHDRLGHLRHTTGHARHMARSGQRVKGVGIGKPAFELVARAAFQGVFDHRAVNVRTAAKIAIACLLTCSPWVKVTQDACQFRLVDHARGLFAADPLSFALPRFGKHAGQGLHTHRIDHRYTGQHFFVIHMFGIGKQPQRSRACASHDTRLFPGFLGRAFLRRHAVDRPALWNDPAARAPGGDQKHLNTVPFYTVTERRKLGADCGFCRRPEMQGQLFDHGSCHCCGPPRFFYL